MMVMFTHRCPHCGRKKQMHVEALGQQVACIQCGEWSVACDPHNESLAMMDTLKEHAELTDLPENSSMRQRAPR